MMNVRRINALVPPNVNVMNRMRRFEPKEKHLGVSILRYIYFA
jgi:hypothetical protein